MTLTMAGWLKTYGAALVVFFAIDLLWLGVVAQGIYQKYLGHMLREDIQWPAAFAFYLLFVAGVVFFVVQPAAARDSVTWAVMAGALFGLVTYAAYDLTNLATLDGFPTVVAVVDLVWGFVLTATVCAGAFKVGGWLLGV